MLGSARRAGSTKGEPALRSSSAGRAEGPDGQRFLPLPVRRPGWLRGRRRAAPYLLLAPSLVGIGLLLVWPTLQISEYSFQNLGVQQVVGSQPTQWVGFSNFKAILTDPEFWASLRISVAFAAVVVPLTLLTGTLVGLLLHRLGRRMATLVSTAALLAWATPAVSASVIFVWLFDPDGGITDWLLGRLPHWLDGGARWTQFNWTNAALPAYTLLTLLVVWQAFPFIAVSVLAGLKMIPEELHDAARVDGAGPWRGFWKVTYPLLKPIFLLLLLLSVIWDFGVFTQAYLVTGELGNRDEYNLGIYAYDKAFTTPPMYGLGSALALVLTVVLLIITVGYVRANIRQGAVQ